MKLATSLLVGALCAVPAPALGDQAFDIGTKGATVRFSDRWERKQLSPDIGPDQFQYSRLLTNHFLAVLEQEGVFETEDDLEAYLRLFTDNLPNAASAPSAVEHVRDGDLRRAICSVDAEFNGVEITYRYVAVGDEGLAYLFMFWTTRSQASKLPRVSDEILDTLRFPGPDTEFGAGLLPRPKRLRLPGWDVELAVRDSIFLDQGEVDILAEYVSGDDTMLFQVMTDEWSDDPDTGIDETLSLLQEDWPAMTEVRRGDVSVSGISSREGYLSDREIGVSAQVVMVPLEPGLMLELRAIYDGPPGARETFREEFLSSVVLSPRSAVDAFPAAAEPAEEPAPVSASRAAFDAETHVLAELDSGTNAWTPAPGGGWIVSGPRAVHTVSPDGGVERLFSEGDWQTMRCTVATGGVLLECGADEIVREIRDGVAGPGSFRARWMWPVEDALLVVRERPVPAVAGFDLASYADDELLMRFGAREKPVAVLDGLRVARFAVAGSGRDALCAATRRSVSTWPAPVELVAVNLPTGTLTPLGSWPEVRHVAPAPDGWLVSGRAEGTPDGVHRLGLDGARELLVSGSDSVGVALEGDDLVVEVRRGYEGGTLRRIALARAREVGPPRAPFHAGLLREIGAQALIGRDPARVLATRTGLDEFLAAAERAARDRVGTALPSTPEAVDALLSELWEGGDLGAEGTLLCSALVARGLCGAGARFVQGPAGPLAFLATRIQDRSNAFAVAHSPFAITRSTLFDEEGWWEPCRTVLQGARGRVILLGEDTARLDAELAAAHAPHAGWEAHVESGTVADLRALLARRPENEHLRELVYLGLAAADRLELVAELAGELVRGEHSTPTDASAWLAARKALESGEGAAEALIRDLRATIARHPDHAALYLLLGEVYRDSGDVERAVACFERVQELEPWGDLNQRAAAALAEVDG